MQMYLLYPINQDAEEVGSTHSESGMGRGVSRGQRNGSPRPLISAFFLSK
jgi:hypothetical protein